MLPTGESDGYGVTSLPISTLVTDGAGETKGRPALVYFYRGSADSDRLEKIEKKMFGHDDLAIASRFFTFYRIDVDAIESDADRKAYAKTTPSIMVLDGQGKKLAAKKGATSARSVTTMLARAFKKTYGGALNRRISQYHKYLEELQKNEDARFFAGRDLAAAEERVSKKASASAKKAVAKAKAKLEALASEKAKLDARAEKLMAATPRKAKGGEASN